MAKESGDFDRNNLDFLRLILASTVALFHVSALSQIPAFSLLGKHLSPHFAVRSFFVISGMLVYRSYMRSSSMRSYFEKRARRIYPAYFTVIVLSALLLFLISSAPAPLYFGWRFWKYLAANLVFLNFLAPTLPGVFAGNDTAAVNGALWTLKIEVIFYAVVPFLSYSCRRFGVNRALASLAALSCAWKYGLLWLDSLHGTSLANSRSIYAALQVQFPGQFIYFCAGILILVCFESLKKHFGKIALITPVCFLIDRFTHSENLDIIWISGVVLLFGFWRYWGNFAKHGDFSYGVYIVHWPVVQTFVAVGLIRLGSAAFLSLTLATILISSALLWNLVESRFLARRLHDREASKSTSSPGHSALPVNVPHRQV